MMIDDDVRLPSGPMVRIRAPRPADAAALARLHDASHAERLAAAGARPESAEHELIVEYSWARRIVAHGVWSRIHGPRGAASITVAADFARSAVPAHLAIRLAQLADAALVPELIVSTGPAGGYLERVARDGFGATVVENGDAALTTDRWTIALAALQHPSAPPEELTAPVRAPRKGGSPAEPVLVAGGGVAALECLMALRDLAGPAARLLLMAPDDSFTYRPATVAEPFSGPPARSYPLAEIAADLGAEFVTDAVAEVRADAREVVCASGAVMRYGTLVLAPGARPVPAFPDAITFGQPGSAETLRKAVAALADGSARDVAFVVPPGTSWSLPLYELALMTARELSKRGVDGARVTFITPEQRPLAVFGPPIGAAVAERLARAGIAFVGSSYSVVEGRRIQFGSGLRTIEADFVVALPQLRGPALSGVPSDRAGFILTDEVGRVPGADRVFAAGDATTFPVKQGGLAAQQADTVAEAIAYDLGSGIAPRPFKPVLRGLLLTGSDDVFLRAGIGGGEGEGRAASDALWWPPTKIAGLYLASYLSERDGTLAAEPPAAFAEVSVPLP